MVVDCLLLVIGCWLLVDVVADDVAAADADADVAAADADVGADVRVLDCLRACMLLLLLSST